MSSVFIEDGLGKLSTYGSRELYVEDSHCSPLFSHLVETTADGRMSNIEKTEWLLANLLSNSLLIISKT